MVLRVRHVSSRTLGTPNFAKCEAKCNLLSAKKNGRPAAENALREMRPMRLFCCDQGRLQQSGTAEASSRKPHVIPITVLVIRTAPVDLLADQKPLEVDVGGFKGNAVASVPYPCRVAPGHRALIEDQVTVQPNLKPAISAANGALHLLRDFQGVPPMAFESG